MNDVYSTDLIGSVIHHLEQRTVCKWSDDGTPLWLNVDNHSIMLLLERTDRTTAPRMASAIRSKLNACWATGGFIWTSSGQASRCRRINWKAG
jgi:hypothetical protein